MPTPNELRDCFTNLTDAFIDRVRDLLYEDQFFLMDSTSTDRYTELFEDLVQEDLNDNEGAPPEGIHLIAAASGFSGKEKMADDAIAFITLFVTIDRELTPMRFVAAGPHTHWNQELYANIATAVEAYFRCLQNEIGPYVTGDDKPNLKDLLNLEKEVIH